MNEANETIFNSAKASLERLHELLVGCNIIKKDCYIEGNPQPHNLDQWIEILRAIETEIYPKLNNTNREKTDYLFKKFAQAGKYRTTTKTPEGTVFTINKTNFNRNINLCRYLEKHLREMADKCGMLIPNKPGAGDAIEDMG